MDYSRCKHLLPKGVPHISAPKDAIEADCRIPGFPLYESPSRDYRQMKYYSMKTNEHLHCHWKCFIEGYGAVVRRPALLPNADYIHFANCQTQFVKPSTTAVDHRRRMRNGPGTDSYGPLPIPNDMHMRKTIGRSRKLPKRDC